jgi:hypothetical protein
VFAERQRTQITVLRRQPLRQLLDASGNGRRLDAARSTDVRQIALPHIVHPVQVGCLCFR